jgi:hypothetical protein
MEPLLLIAALAMLHLMNLLSSRRARLHPRLRMLDATDAARWEDEGGASVPQGRTAVANP